MFIASHIFLTQIQFCANKKKNQINTIYLKVQDSMKHSFMSNIQVSYLFNADTTC